MRFRPGLRQTIRANASRALELEERLADQRLAPCTRASLERHLAAARATLEKPVRTRKPAGSDGKPLERDIQRACIELLQSHPKVRRVIRVNSGAVQGESATGKRYFVRFASEPLPDIYVILKDGLGCAWFEIKRPGWLRPTDAREARQAAFLQDVRQSGGIGEFITDPQQIVGALA